MMTKATAQAAKNALSPHARRETQVLRSYSFATYSTMAMIISFLPLYFMEQGFSEQQIGILYAVGPMMSIFASLLAGMVSDRYKTIKKVLIVLLVGQIVMLSLLQTTNQFTVICLIMAGFYFFQTPIYSMSDSLILLSTRFTGTPYALIRIFGSMGFAVTAYLVGHLLKLLGTSWTIPIALSTICITLIIVLLLRDYQGDTTQKAHFKDFFKLLRQRSLLIFFGLLFIVAISHRMYEGFLGVTLRHLGASESQIGLAWLISSTSEIPVLFLLGKYGHRFKELPLLSFAAIAYGLRLVLLGQTSDPQIVVAAQVMHSLSFGIFFSTALRYLSQLIPDEFRTTGQAVFSVVYVGLAGITSGTIGGFLYENYGRVVFYHIAAIVAFTAAIGFMWRHITLRFDHQ